MSQATALIESDNAVESENDRVFRRRCDELRRAGYGPEAATLLAANHNVDLDLAIELRARRCTNA
jgi:hypothetical protein